MEFLIIVLFGFALMWVLIVLPQRRRHAAHARMVSELEPGDEILTAGGLYATVEEVGDEDVRVELGPGLRVRLAKRAVAAVLPPEEPAEPEGPTEAGESQEPADAALGENRR